MKKRNIKECLKKIPDSGFTLMEVMVSVGIAGIVMLVFGSLMSQSASFSSFFNSSASSIEGAADVVANVNAVLPQVVSVHTCRCRGSALPNNLSNCIWDDSTPWYDPVHNGGADDSAATGLSLIVGEIEMFNGGTNVANTTQLLRSNIAASNYMNNIGGCLNYTAFPAAQLRGCKMNFQINYKAPDIEVGSTPAKAGFVFIRLGDSGQDGIQYIGMDNRNGAGGIGVTEASCGFVQTSGGTTGLLFALNIKVKTRSTFIQTVSSSNYESWHPAGKNYNRGLFREIRLKHAFRNLSTRGVYQWRMQSQRGCLQNGEASTNKEQCCSLALVGGVCGHCIPSGESGTAANCCSEKVAAGVCQ